MPLKRARVASDSTQPRGGTTALGPVFDFSHMAICANRAVLPFALAGALALLLSAVVARLVAVASAVLTFSESLAQMAAASSAAAIVACAWRTDIMPTSGALSSL